MSTPDRATGHLDVGAYVLGILDGPDEAAFAKHFAGCARCRAEYRELADLPRLLDQLKSEHPVPAPSEVALNGALAEISSARRGRRRNTWLAAAAAGVLLVAVPIAVWRSGDDTAPPVAGPTVTVSPSETTDTPEVAGARTLTGTDPASGATAILTVDGDAVDTTIDMHLLAVSGPAKGELTAVTRTGHREEVARWEIGFDQPSVKVSGTVDIPIREIIGYEIRQADGPVKLDISA